MVTGNVSLTNLGMVDCGLIIGKDAVPVVAIIGKQKGMHIWNPWTSIVEKVCEEMPFEEGEHYSLIGGEIVSIKGGTELLLYGGQVSEEKVLDGIWRYIVSENQWTK